MWGGAVVCSIFCSENLCWLIIEKQTMLTMFTKINLYNKYIK